MLPRLTAIAYRDLPAFIAPLPANLWFVQRREFFASALRFTRPISVRQNAGQKEIRFRLFDLSLGGMGALMDTPKPEGLVEGMRFSQIELDMGGWGRFWFDAQLIAISERKVVDSKTKPLPRRD